jgi:hypothetical protein
MMFSTKVTNDILVASLKSSLDFNLDLTKIWWETWATAFDLECWTLKRTLTLATLQLENQRFQGTGGVSACNCGAGFVPAFWDSATESVYPSCFPNGSLSPIHTFDGLPNDVVLERDSCGRVTAIKPTLVAGFLREGHFFTREQTARLLAAQNTN